MTSRLSKRSNCPYDKDVTKKKMYFPCDIYSRYHNHASNLLLQSEYMYVQLRGKPGSLCVYILDMINTYLTAESFSS